MIKPCKDRFTVTPKRRNGKTGTFELRTHIWHVPMCRIKSFCAKCDVYNTFAACFAPARVQSVFFPNIYGT